jgi:hypothetical protein
MKYLLGIALGLLLLIAPIARADGIFPGETIFDETRLVDGVDIRYVVEVIDITPQGFDLWDFCIGPNPLASKYDCRKHVRQLGRVSEAAY